MNKLKNKRFLIIPPSPTIFSYQCDDIDSIISEGNQKNVFSYILKYCDGVLLAGTTGYGPMLTTKQYQSLIKIALDLKINNYPEKIIFVGSIAASKGKVKEMIRKAIEVEKEFKNQNLIDGFVVAPQSFFYKQTQSEIILSMKDIALFANRYGKAIYLYNISRAGTLLQPETVKILKEISNIAGIKDSSGDYMLYKEYLKLQCKNFLVFQGKPQFDLQTMKDKGDGIIDANANFAPSLMREVVNLYLDGQIEKSKELHQRVYDATNYLNHRNEVLAENRLASRIAQLYLLGIIDQLPVSLTEPELKQISQGLIKNKIPKVENKMQMLFSSNSYTYEDYNLRLRGLINLNYKKNGSGRFIKKN